MRQVGGDAAYNADAAYAVASHDAAYNARFGGVLERESFLPGAA